ncbi:hypothetical protein SAMN05421858_3460 [Haladaptatus litoreus]|uniref:Uncharacterized protein n=1 Tax=Haladaptatus litoreus TaxID=553468 RepID=A0A1N7DA80_9EURY|nr:hypothetical protein [Haladaptatus litoreus]SIR72738.1 hypothetical protein SAMN05421858_3460 [Haladaptatus litoreus]
MKRFDENNKPTMNLSIQYLNKSFGIIGRFLFINGIHEAFFSSNLLSSFSYYLIILFLIGSVINYIRPIETPSVTDKIQVIREVIYSTKISIMNQRLSGALGGETRSKDE